MWLSTSATDCMKLERLVSEMTYYVSNVALHILTHYDRVTVTVTPDAARMRLDGFQHLNVKLQRRYVTLRRWWNWLWLTPDGKSCDGASRAGHVLRDAFIVARVAEVDVTNDEHWAVMCDVMFVTGCQHDGFTNALPAHCRSWFTRHETVERHCATTGRLCVTWWSVHSRRHCTTPHRRHRHRHRRRHLLRQNGKIQNTQITKHICIRNP